MTDKLEAIEMYTKMKAVIAGQDEQDAIYALEFLLNATRNSFYSKQKNAEMARYGALSQSKGLACDPLQAGTALRQF